MRGTELPATVTARCYAGVGLPTATLSMCNTGSGHGTAVAETLMDVTPAAQLYIANGATPAALVVERAMYGDGGNERCALGSDALATPWPP